MHDRRSVRAVARVATRLLLAAALGLAGCRAAAREASTPATAGDATRLALEPYQRRLRVVRVRAAGREWRLLFDTGGGVTLVSPALAAAMRCEPRGRVRSHRMSGEPFEAPTCAPAALDIGGWAAPPQTVAVFDLMTLLPRDWPRLDGLVSLRSFAGRRLTVDLAANELLVGDTRAPQPPGALRIPGRLATGPGGAELLAFAGLTVGADTLWLEIDSANLDDVLLAPHAARLLGLADSVGAVVDSAALPLPPGARTVVRARVRPLLFDGALNSRWLEGGRLTADLSTGALWWEPRAAR